MKRLITIFFIVSLFSASPDSLRSQIKEYQHIGGACIGFWLYGSSPTLGLNYDYTLPQMGIGLFSVGGIFRYWSYTQKFDDGTQWNYTNAVFAGQLNYNFNTIGKGKFIPYAGLVLGYNSIGTKYKSYDTNSIIRHDALYGSSIVLWTQVGFRYFFTPKIAGTFRLGLGNLDFSEIELGVDYKF